MQNESHMGKRARRDEAIVQRRRQGETLEEIGESFGLTRERIRQIVIARGGPTTHELRAARASAGRREMVAERGRLLKIIKEHPGCTRERLAELAGVEEQLLGRILGKNVRLLVVEKNYERMFSDDEIALSIRRVARHAGEPLSHVNYDRTRREIGGPSAVRIIQRFTTWSAACRLAGVQPGQPRRSGYTRRWSSAEMLEWVARYLESGDCRGTYAGYQSWASAIEGAPSAQTVRNTVGLWSVVKRAALALVYARDNRSAA